VLPIKPRGVPRVDDRRTLNGIFWVLHSGAPSASWSHIARPASDRRTKLDGRSGPEDIGNKVTLTASEVGDQIVTTLERRLAAMGAELCKLGAG
jgi:hypothetical protein